MRVTQSMLSNSMLNNLGNSYNKLGKLQNQIATGSKLLRPSDDPVGVTKAMSYRTQLTANEQYASNLDTAAKWLDTTDTSLGSVSSAMTRIQELVTQAANDTNQTVDREKILAEIDQIHAEIHDIANTKIGDEYIFSGTRTREPLYVKTATGQEFNNKMQPTPTTTSTDNNGFTASMNVEIYNGIQLEVNTPGALEMFSKIDETLTKVKAALQTGTGEQIGSLLGGTNSTEDQNHTTIQGAIDLVLKNYADVGAKENRVDMMADRLSSQKITLTKQQSNVESVEYEEAITQLTTQTSIHNAALSVGSKIIQQTLVDFMR